MIIELGVCELYILSLLRKVVDDKVKLKLDIKKTTFVFSLVPLPEMTAT